MRSSLRTVAIIPARKGSKRVTGKNRLTIGGKTLLERTAAAIEDSGVVNEAILSTDDPELIEAEKNNPAIKCIMRPKDLSGPTTTTESVLRYLIDSLSLIESRIILLQLTSPFRTGSDVKQLYSLMDNRKKSTGVSVCRWRTPPSVPFGEAREPNQLGKRIFEKSNEAIRAQDSSWAVNGAVYIFDAKIFMETGRMYNEESAIHVMENWRSIDIDYDDDVKIAQAIAEFYAI